MSAGLHGHATLLRLAVRLAGERGIPQDFALELVRAFVRVLRDDLESSARVVIPGVLIVDRMPEGSRRRHRARFVLNVRRRHAEAIKRYRARRSSAD